MARLKGQMLEGPRNSKSWTNVQEEPSLTRKMAPRSEKAKFKLQCFGETCMLESVKCMNSETICFALLILFLTLPPQQLSRTGCTKPTDIFHFLITHDTLGFRSTTLTGLLKLLLLTQKSLETGLWQIPGQNPWESPYRALETPAGEWDVIDTVTSS